MDGDPKANNGSPMTILGTGGTDFIGSHTVLALKQQGMCAVVHDNLTGSDRHIAEDVLYVALVVGDVGDGDLIDDLPRGNHPYTEVSPLKL